MDTAPDAVLEQVQTILGRRFRDRELLRAALTHASSANHRLASNERLEFLGDSVLGSVVCEELFRRFPEYLEGDLTKVKSVVVSRKTCADMAKRLGLDRYIFLGKGMPGRADLPPSLAAAVFEAITAAYYLDAGFEAVRTWLLDQVRPEIDAMCGESRPQNYKSLLQQHSQREYGVGPQYRLVSESGPDHRKRFEVAVMVGDRRFRCAAGNNKKDAEQRAAWAALAEMGVVAPPPGWEDAPLPVVTGSAVLPPEAVLAEGGSAVMDPLDALAAADGVTPGELRGQAMREVVTAAVSGVGAAATGNGHERRSRFDDSGAVKPL